MDNKLSFAICAGCSRVVENNLVEQVGNNPCCEDCYAECSKCGKPFILRERGARVLVCDKCIDNERDARVRYIDAEGNNDHYVIMLEYIRVNAAGVAKDLFECGRDGFHGEFVPTWYNHALDFLITKIDWSDLSECRECQDLFNPSYDNDEFCGDDCKEVFEANNPAGVQKADN